MSSLIALLKIFITIDKSISSGNPGPGDELNDLTFLAELQAEFHVRKEIGEVHPQGLTVECRLPYYLCLR